mmetsp:Transcript_7069/g.10133  ORF Transcript_7069/g.10133 Transcript_7069/m.10133 type:complete len:672 (-) Transcript_7069:173-2188(-)|eukprot:CAMPEP_0184866196 /NCGR_PEP_ID=MMETSP0580-20130426/21268_1 /TAXON_ID=1118495 /ORGANISM="Dactyliosolen fragilissimus" /LENGTH=671 /DNA_ID=CAMNT_0027365731 /DNA_START=182 /DNA_END=2197 /DNA_ORIENTATION=+
MGQDQSTFGDDHVNFSRKSTRNSSGRKMVKTNSKIRSASKTSRSSSKTRSRSASKTRSRSASKSRTPSKIQSPDRTYVSQGSESRSQHEGDIDVDNRDVRDDENDKKIGINLAMADLMAYLQVVAVNSSNLPLTTRDDPELNRTVSTLTAEEYAIKSSAFIPSNVRVIGGSYLRYGRVWDLPVSEDFTVSDGAKEPGISTGGACCNALLKVLYDGGNDSDNDDMENKYLNSDNLFSDEDDDESILNEKSFESLQLGGGFNDSDVTWGQLLRRMKEEIKDVGFAQVPTLTTSQKFDLNQPFSFVSSNFDAEKNKRRSLFIGCNYADSPDAKLKASHDDIRSMKDYIVNVHGFPEKKGDMTILLDDGKYSPPTHSNIIEAFKALAAESHPGDAVFIQFSGHGGRILDTSASSEGDTYDEIIIPSDTITSGFIRDKLIFKTLLAPMRQGVTITILIDCCDKGFMLDLPYAWSTKHDQLDTMPKLSLNDNFSFVRFLKVVKTMYEMSTFTQLGKTVGTALHESAVPFDDELGGDETFEGDSLGEGSLETMGDEEEDEEEEHIEEETEEQAPKSLAKSFGDFVSNQSPEAKNLVRKLNQLVQGSNSSQNGTEGGSTILEKYLSCNFTNQGEDSDDYEVKRHTDDHSDGLSDDYSDEEYASEGEYTDLQSKTTKSRR